MDNKTILQAAGQWRKLTEEEYKIVQMYEPLIYKYCYINGVYDRDCEAYIKINVLKAIKKSRN